MDIMFVSEEAQLPEMAAALASASRVALDVEWRPDGLFEGSGSSKSAPAATLQLAVDGATAGGAARVFVVDLLCLHVRRPCRAG